MGPKPSSPLQRERAAAAFLIALGTAQMAADLAELPTLKAAISAWGASPAPKVFSTVQGLETFSTEFQLEWRRPDGSRARSDLTPKVYARLDGPYNRRNAYGAALAYAPVLAANPATNDMYQAVSQYAFCSDGGLVEELGYGPSQGPYRVLLKPKPTTAPDPNLSFEYLIGCDAGR